MEIPYRIYLTQNQQVNRNYSQDSTLCCASCFTFSLQLTNCPLITLWYLCLEKLCLEFSKKDCNSTKNRSYVLFTLVSLRNTPSPSFSNQIVFLYLACFSEIVAIYCIISTDRQHQLVYSISLLKQVTFITT